MTDENETGEIGLPVESAEANAPKRTRRARRTLEERRADAIAELERVKKQEMVELFELQVLATEAVKSFADRAEAMGIEKASAVANRIYDELRKLVC